MLNGTFAIFVAFSPRIFELVYIARAKARLWAAAAFLCTHTQTHDTHALVHILNISCLFHNTNLLFECEPSEQTSWQEVGEEEEEAEPSERQHRWMAGSFVAFAISLLLRLCVCMSVCAFVVFTFDCCFPGSGSGSSIFQWLLQTVSSLFFGSHIFSQRFGNARLGLFVVCCECFFFICTIWCMNKIYVWFIMLCQIVWAHELRVSVRK